MAMSTDQWFLNFLVLRDLFPSLKIIEDHPHPKFLVYVDYINLHLCEKLELRNLKILPTNSKITTPIICLHKCVVEHNYDFQITKLAT